MALQFLHLVISQIFIECLILNGYSGSGDTVVDKNVNSDFLGIFLVRYAIEASQQAVNQKRGVTGYGMSTENAELPQRGVSPLTSFTALVTCCLVVVLFVYVFFFFLNYKTRFWGGQGLCLIYPCVLPCRQFSS